MLTSPPTHRRELRDLGFFLLLFGALAAETFLLPQTASVRPWVEGERLPLVGLMDSEPQEQLAPSNSEIPERAPAVYVALEHAERLGFFFQGLREIEEGKDRTVRVLHFGDSTIAADGIPGAIRRRFQTRFGDRGPGFLPLHVDTRWVYRPGVSRLTSGEWETWNLTQGGAPHRRYGLGGSPSRLTGRGGMELVWKGLEPASPPLTQATLHLQKQPGGGTVRIRLDSGEPVEIATRSEQVQDHRETFTAASGFQTVAIESLGNGPVSFYGVALDRGTTGVTWETLGVAGSSIGSMRRQNPEHLQSEIAARSPSLLVYQTGGNALGYDSFKEGDGEAFLEQYLNVLGRLRSGAPGASCLLVGPLDQGIRVRGRVESKKDIPRMIGIQRAAADAAGCAFWDAREVMGGEGGFARWMAHEPTLTWTDLMHLSQEGSLLVGERFADALLQAYERSGPVDSAESEEGGP